MRSEHDGRRARVEAADKTAGLALVTEIEAVPGGAIRARHTLTNIGRQPYVVDSLEVVFPLPGRVGEVLDFTGRQTAERIPQRHQIGDGLWLREGRRGHTGHDSATVLVAGVPGFGFGSGEVYGLHVAWSGNTVHRVERVPSGLGMAGARRPDAGGAACCRERPPSAAASCCCPARSPWPRASRTPPRGSTSRPPGPAWTTCRPSSTATCARCPRTRARPRPVNLNVWEAVYFRHDFGKLAALADVAADVGVERYVLDDGWFAGRRSDQAGLGDWRVDEDVWPGGLHRLVGLRRGRGLQFGLWIEPEMVNPDSDLYRAHPDWILAAGQRRPPLQRHQLVLDLTRPEVSGYLLERISALMSEYEISYVKWDCNRDIIDAGSGARSGAPAAHDQALAVYALLDELRRRHPGVEWESCAAGGGRIDLGMLERVQRVWTSDMTDALARQSIQRWTGQLVPPEYLGAHVSAPFSHQTGRYMPLSLRCATALFGHFGIDADITQATRRTSPSSPPGSGCTSSIALSSTPAAWSGSTPRTTPPGCTASSRADQSAALMSYAQLDEPRNDQPAALRVPGLDPLRRYRVTDVTPACAPARRSGLRGPASPGSRSPAPRWPRSAWRSCPSGP